MGRGRAKAKQQRIARELKYFAPPTDLTALQQELTTHPYPPGEDHDAPGHGADRENSPAR